ncbi:uncharacterized protein G2W53_027811 [Senna tora]|uniref:Uncharacterized protein n=1 Tax=Senna tora TaxID=362788 RepID=A0A834TKA5_9FABA|nr:uncharacterized protein G2W53_027811 [Senna tora]
MKKISVLTILFLLGFLFLINALGHSSARGNINILGEKDQNELEESSSDGINGGHHHVRKLGFGEKKAKDEYYSSMVYSSKISGASSTYSDDGISCGDDCERSEGVLDEVKNDAFKKSMGTLEEEEEMDDQKMKDDILISNYLAMKKKPNPPLSSKGVQVIIRKARRLSMSSHTSSTRPERSQISQELLPPQAHELDQKEKEEEEKTQKDIGLEVEEEIVNLIHNDYKGMARRKPPINNHEPRN